MAIINEIERSKTGRLLVLIGLVEAWFTGWMGSGIGFVIVGFSIIGLLIR